MTTVLLRAAIDATTLANVPTRNFANEPLLSVSSAADYRYAFVFFNRPFPIGVKITKATLRLYQAGNSTGGTRTVTARRIDRAWKESTITSANRPGVTGATASVTKGDGGGNGRVWEFDVTAHLQQISDGAAWYGFRLEGNVATRQYFYARQSSEFHPTLEVVWSDAPAAPSALSPSNGRAVSIARPTLTFDFTDISGDKTMLGYQVQMSSDGAFTAPAYDSGAVAADYPQHEVTFDVLAAATWWWRVRVQDGAGIWSDWSASTSFTRTGKATVEILNPAAAPNDFVSESTPPIIWQVTGTQAAYQVFLTDPLDTTEVLWTTGKVTSSDTSVSIPKKSTPLLSPGGTYNVILHVWDGIAREGTPGDPTYARAARTFTFNLDPTINPVTSLVATSLPPYPHVTLTWERATAPDSFMVTLDGVTIRENLDPADLLVSGTSYALTIPSVTPAVAHAFVVGAVVNGVTSKSNPTATVTASPEGVWLSSLDGAYRVCLTGADGPVTAQASELATVHKPVGAKNPVLITQAVFGREGSVSGFLSGGQPGMADVSLADWLADWTTLTDRRKFPAGTPMMLTLSDTAMRVFIHATVREPAIEFGRDIPVSFDYCELL